MLKFSKKYSIKKILNFSFQVPRERGDSESSYNPSDSLDESQDDSNIMGHVESPESEETEAAAN